MLHSIFQELCCYVLLNSLQPPSASSSEELIVMAADDEEMWKLEALRTLEVPSALRFLKAPEPTATLQS